MDLVDIYSKQIRSVLELAVPAWHEGLMLAEQIDIERVQKYAAHIILGSNYETYKPAVKTLGLDTFEAEEISCAWNLGRKLRNISSLANGSDQLPSHTGLGRRNPSTAMYLLSTPDLRRVLYLSLQVD